ncbi:response regulator [Synechocystis salina LEGE 06155]|nr:response regulator [Synechocystis salina LEGE 06155]
MVGMANRPGGYDQQILKFLEPFLITCSNLIEGFRLDRQRREAQLQLQETNQELLRVTRLKDEFLANMSHELRTPLNAILGNTEILQEEIFGEINPKQSQSLDAIESSANHLLSLINDILDLAKIEAGQIELEMDSVFIPSLCEASLGFIKQQAQKKKIQIQTQIGDNLPELWGDERRLRQVLINLLNNAVKFTPEGGRVALTVEWLPCPKGEDYSRIRFSIADTGIGIAPEDITKLFHPFVQIDSALNREYEGTGLGLVLVKQVVEMHGGEVSLTSKVGVGSTFVVDIPCKTPEHTTVINGQSPTGIPLDDLASDSTATLPLVLLVEDNLSNAEAVGDYLQIKGYRVTWATDGFQALDIAQREQPQIILIDIQMGGMDGLTAIKRLRQIPALAQIPIIALTALSMDGDRERCLAAGANEYLSKPVKLKQLETVVDRLLVPLE